MASKIPSILNVFQGIFNQAWSLSSTKAFDREDKDGFFANTYRAYNCLMTLVCCLVIAFDKPLASFLYAKEFYPAWRYVPWLSIAVLFGALVGYLEGFFIAVKDSKTPAICTAIGAVLNILLNLVLTPALGALGAAVATAICYVVIWSLRLLLSMKYIHLKINIKRDIFSYLVLVLQSLGLIFIQDELLSTSIILLSVLFIFFVYRKDLFSIFKKIFDKN